MSRPNILFILIDDLGWRDVTCFGSEFYETPHIDALAQEGMLFTDAYAACPVCSPTRASILTGKYPARLGLTNFIDSRWAGHPRRGRVIDVPYIHHLSHDEKTLASALKEQGYDTCHVGKWHLGGRDYYPDRHGFDVNIGGCDWGRPVHGYFSPWGIETLPETGEEDRYLTDVLTDRAIKWLENRTEAPFFLNLWYYAVHDPLQAKPELIEKYEQKAKAMGLDRKPVSKAFGIDPFDPDRKWVMHHRILQSHATYAAMIETLE
jgi:arylsulfatase A-like enzyme